MAKLTTRTPSPGAKSRVKKKTQVSEERESKWVEEDDEEIEEEEAFGSDDEKEFAEFFKSKSGKEEKRMKVTAAATTSATSTDGHVAEEETRWFYVRHFPNFLTSITITSGLCVMLAGQVDFLEKWHAVVAVLVGLLTDILDGVAARKLNVKSLIGANFDQLADLTAFGISPAVFLFRAIFIPMTFPNH